MGNCNNVMGSILKNVKVSMPDYIGKSSSIATSTGTITVSVPSGYQQNDLLLLLVAGDDAYPNDPSGWTLINESNFGIYFSVYYKIAGASESSVSCTDPGSNESQLGEMFCFRGVNVSSPINAHTVRTDEAASFTASSVTTNLDNCMVVIALGLYGFLGDTDTALVSSWINSNLVSITEAEDMVFGNSLTESPGLALAYGIKVNSGVVGSTSITTSPGTYSDVAVTIALAPAV